MTRRANAVHVHTGLPLVVAMIISEYCGFRAIPICFPNLKDKRDPYISTLEALDDSEWIKRGMMDNECCSWEKCKEGVMGLYMRGKDISVRMITPSCSKNERTMRSPFPVQFTDACGIVAGSGCSDPNDQLVVTVYGHNATRHLLHFARGWMPIVPALAENLVILGDYLYSILPKVKPRSILRWPLRRQSQPAWTNIVVPSAPMSGFTTIFPVSSSKCWLMGGSRSDDHIYEFDAVTLTFVRLSWTLPRPLQHVPHLYYDTINQLVYAVCDLHFPTVWVRDMTLDTWHERDMTLGTWSHWKYYTSVK